MLIRQFYQYQLVNLAVPMERIIAGDVPESLTLERLKNDFPIEWEAQRSHFGLSQAPTSDWRNRR